MSGKLPNNLSGVNNEQLTLPPGKLAKALGVSAMTLWRYRQLPDFPRPRKTPTGGQQFLMDEVRDYFNSLPEAISERRPTCPAKQKS